MGATTLWECWNCEGSHCHHMFSAVSAFFYEYVAGIVCREPGWKKIDITPALDCGLKHVRASLDTVLGIVGCTFDSDGDEYSIHVEIPHGATGALHLPGKMPISLNPGVHRLKLKITY